MSAEKNSVVAEDVAKAEFERFVDMMDLDVDPKHMDSEDLESFNTQKRRIIREIVRGNLVINENGEAAYTPWRSKVDLQITFHEQTGAALMAVDGRKSGKDVAKTFSVMAEMCGVPANTFAKLSGTDIKVCMAIFALLMD